MLSIPALNDADIAFGNIDHMPNYADIPAEFKRYSNPYVRAVSGWFFGGAKRSGDELIIDGVTFRAKSGVDATKALKAIRAVLVSFAPKHEHKEAACAYMLSEWFDILPANETV